MKVRYGKAKNPIVFGVGGVIVAMVTTFFVEIFLVNALPAAVLLGSSSNLA